MACKQKYILLLFIVHLSSKSFCQKTVFIEKYDLPAEIKKAGQVIIEMPFGYDTILNVFGDTAGLKKMQPCFYSAPVKMH